MFSISVDPARRLIEVKVSGLLSLADVRRLAQEHAGLLKLHGIAPGTYGLLCDATDFLIQTQEVHEALGALGHDPRLVAARSAILTGPSAHRMQARRATPPYPLALFDSRAEAIAWLCESWTSAQTDQFDRRAA